MSRFRKVNETENIPSFIEKRFVGSQVNIEDDPYAELRNNSAENQFKISKETIGLKKEASNFEKSWEKISGASMYQDHRTESIADRILSQELGAIKRADYGTDEGLNARTTTSGLKAFSADDYMNAMLSKSASIFNPDMIAISEEFLTSQTQSSEQSVVEMQRRREAKASRHQSWEEKQINNLRKSQVVNSRAHNILRTSNDLEHTSQFGMVDPEALDAREAQRVASQNTAREARLAIKKNIKEEFETKAQNRAQTISDIYSSIDINFDID
jgi:hypothetical protein